MIRRELEIINKLGLHARAATKFSQTASKFSSDIQVTFKSKTVDAKSIMSLMLLAAAKGSVLELQIEGDDEQLAWDALKELVDNRFDEGE